MARLYPSDLSAPALAGLNPGELETLKRLAKELPEDYSVFHSVHWSKVRHNGKSHGEIDFVIVNRSGDVLVIEQKDGRLEETPEGLRKRYANGPKLVSSQIERNTWNINDRFVKQTGVSEKLSIEPLIYCPGHQVVDVTAPGIDMSRTVDAKARDNLAERIMELLGPGVNSDDNRAEIVCAFFAQTFRIVPDVSSYVSSHDREYTLMLKGLADDIAKLEFSPYRLRVVGTAGCGKSQLTLSFCERALADGKTPLLLCFNRPLADRLRSLAPEGVSVDSYYGFCKEKLEALNGGVTVEPTQEPGFWRDVQEQLVGVDIPDDVRFDTLVVDEGQDFKQEWWEILQLFLTDDASVLWLEDPLQNLRQTDDVTLDGFVTYREEANYRTPKKIGDVIRHALGVSFEQCNQLPGMDVHVEGYEKAADQHKHVAHRVNELRKLGFSNEQIVIVSCRGMASSAFSDCDTIGSLPVRRFTGEYSADGEQVYSDGKLFFDTIYRFKGQQAPAVILVDIDESLGDSDFAKRVLYCGMTRASVRLEMLVQAQSPWLQRLQGAA